MQVGGGVLAALRAGVGVQLGGGLQVGFAGGFSHNGLRLFGGLLLGQGRVGRLQRTAQLILCGLQGRLLGVQRRAGSRGFLGGGLSLGTGGGKCFGFGVQLRQRGTVVRGQLTQCFGEGQHLVQAAGLQQQGNAAAAVQQLHRSHLVFAVCQAGVVLGLLVGQGLRGLLGSSGALIQQALGILQSCVDVA